VEEVSALRIMEMNAEEWPYITLGCISALIQGSVQPIWALVFGIMLGVSVQLELLPFLRGYVK